MRDGAMPRRGFLSSACGTMGLLSLAGGLAPLPAAERTSGKTVPPGLQAVRDKLLADMEASRGLGVPRADGDFLHLLVHVTAARKALEVGTFRGYSAIRMGLGLEQTGGKLITIDIDPARVQESRRNIDKAGLSDRITVLEGDAHQVAKTVEGPFDLVFLDAEKGNELDYFQTVFPKLRPGGFLLVHNAITSKRAMQPYLDKVAKDREILHLIVSLTLRDGFSVSFRKPRPV